MSKLKVYKKENLAYVGSYIIKKYMDCGDSYYGYNHYKFEGTKNECATLIKLFKKFNRILELRDITQTSFVFEAINGTCNKSKTNKFFFKLCRYVRERLTLDILYKMNNLIDNNIKPYNAILLAHYITKGNVKYGSYTSSMDIVIGITSTYNYYYTFRNWEQFIERMKLTLSYSNINQIYKHKGSNSNTRKKIHSLITSNNKDDYKKLQRMLLLTRSK